MYSQVQGGKSMNLYKMYLTNKLRNQKINHETILNLSLYQRYINRLEEELHFHLGEKYLEVEAPFKGRERNYRFYHNGKVVISDLLETFKFKLNSYNLDFYGMLFTDLQGVLTALENKNNLTDDMGLFKLDHFLSKLSKTEEIVVLVRFKSHGKTTKECSVKEIINDNGYKDFKNFFVSKIKKISGGRIYLEVNECKPQSTS